METLAMDKSLLWPLVAQVWLTIFVAFSALYARIQAYKQGEVRALYFKHNKGKAPEFMLRWSDNLQNQFELPVLFYVLLTLLLVMQQTSTLFVILAWLFVISRVIHLFIHIKTNHIGHRRNSFLVGFVVIVLMWFIFTVQILIQ